MRLVGGMWRCEVIVRLVGGMWRCEVIERLVGGMWRGYCEVGRRYVERLL